MPTIPEPSIKAPVEKTPVFTMPDGSTVDRFYRPVDHKLTSSQMVAPGDSENREKFALEVAFWREKMKEDATIAAPPVPVGHVVLRPVPPMILTKEERDDGATMRKLIRNYDPIESPLSAKNGLYLANLLQTGHVVEDEEKFPEKGLNGSDVLVKNHVNESLPWSSHLVPMRPNPALFSDFYEYEAAMVRWYQAVCADMVPIPSPEQVGTMVNRKAEAKREMAAPPPPNHLLQDPEPLHKAKLKECTPEGQKDPHDESSVVWKLHTLQRDYTKKILNPCLPKRKKSSKEKGEGESGEKKHTSKERPSSESEPAEKSRRSKKSPAKKRKRSEVLFPRAVCPAHARLGAQEIVERMKKTGVPVASIEADGMTNAMRHERMIFDVGFMARDLITADGNKELTHDEAKWREMLQQPPDETNKTKQLWKFVFIDWSPKEFIAALNTKLNDEMTIGEYLCDQLSLEELVTMSFFSLDYRFVTKLSVLVQHFLTLSRVQDKLLQLDIPSLERFVELATFMALRSCNLELIPDDELAQACHDDPSRDSQIEMFATSFRQAHMLSLLYSVVISGSAHFPKMIDFMRQEKPQSHKGNLLHRSYQKIVEICASDQMFPAILDGFFSPNTDVHRFNYRLLRMTFTFQYTKIIRVISGHDLLGFMQRGINSKNSDIRRHTHSLWQLIRHSDTALVFQLQLIQAQPSSVVTQIGSATMDSARFLQSIFSVFRTLHKAFDYRPLPFTQFQAFFNALTGDFSRPQYINFLYSLLRFCVEDESLYYNKMSEKTYLALLNNFTAKNAVKLIQNQSLQEMNLDASTIAQMKIMKMKCLRLLCRVRSLDHVSIANIEIWTSILTKMSSKVAGVEAEREQAWKIFRNAVLYQSKFVEFLLTTPELCKKMEDAFSSLDFGVGAEVIQTLEKLALAAAHPEDPDNGGRVDMENLDELWRKLADPAVRINGKILSNYHRTDRDTSSGNVTAPRVHSAVVSMLKCMVTSTDHSPLRHFMKAEHIVKELNGVFAHICGVLELSWKDKQNEVQQMSPATSSPLQQVSSSPLLDD